RNRNVSRQTAYGRLVILDGHTEAAGSGVPGRVGGAAVDGRGPLYKDRAARRSTGQDGGAVAIITGGWAVAHSGGTVAGSIIAGVLDQISAPAQYRCFIIDYSHIETAIAGVGR